MCGRFAFHSPRETVAEVFGVDCPLELEPRYNIAPSQHVLALRDTGTGWQPVMLRWGLVPFWAKDPSIGNRMINARAETVAEKPAYRRAFKKQRCAVLADGFYEWQKTESGKVPHYIHAADGRPFAMAGLWEHWDGDGEALETCTIITTAANAFMRALHHRMPVIVDGERLDTWLDHSLADRERLAQLLGSADEREMIANAVSREVNNPGRDGPQLIRPA